MVIVFPGRVIVLAYFWLRKGLGTNRESFFTISFKHTYWTKLTEKRFLFLSLSTKKSIQSWNMASFITISNIYFAPFRHGTAVFAPARDKNLAFILWTTYGMNSTNSTTTSQAWASIIFDVIFINDFKVNEVKFFLSPTFHFSEISVRKT